MAFLGQEEQVREFQDRFRYLYVVLFGGLGLLLARLVFLQVLKGEQMRHYSEENRIKRVKVEAPRGMIFDRNRKLLIDNRPAFDLEVIPQYLKEAKQTDQVVALLSKLLNMPAERIRDILEEAKGQASFMPVKIKTDLSRDEVAAIESWKISMPGVEVRQEIKRTNVYGEIASHLLGYVGEISPIELPIVNKTLSKYKLGDVIGKSGLEQKMEDTVRGQDGEDLKEVDALGRVKLGRGRGRMLAETPGREAIPGKNLVLTIDQDLQQAADKAFGDKIGSVVAINPQNGEILAMLSRPSFDTTEFSRGIPTDVWTKLINNENHPLRDKTIQDHYAPGSTFKIVTALAGLTEGVIDENTTFHCGGSYKVGNHLFHCHKKGGHGNVNIISAITQSCDVYFYHVAQKLKSVDDIAKWATALGLGTKTGIPLAREVPGLIPTEEWKMQRYHQPWNQGETVSVAIGQSYVLATAIQLANMYATVGNGGTLYRPSIVKEIESYDGKLLKTFQPEISRKIQIPAKALELVKQGLWGVVNGQHGTAHASMLPGMDFAGKTGTAQVMHIAANKIYSKCENYRFQDRNNALFVGMAPVNNPQIAVAVIAEHSCHGASAAAPIAKAVIKTYLEKYFPEIYGEKALKARLLLEGKTPVYPMKSLSSEKQKENEDEDVLIPDESTNPTQAPLTPPLPALPPIPPREGLNDIPTETNE